MNDYPLGDLWRLVDNDKASQNFGKSFLFDFSSFGNTELYFICKEYIWKNYITGTRSLKGLTETMRRLRVFNDFCKEYRIEYLTELDNNLIDDYRSFLRLYKSTFTGKNLSYSTQRACFSALRTLIGWCNVYSPKSVPQRQIFTGYEYRQNYSKLKIDFIPDDILRVINKELENESNPYLKYGIQILETTGMRIGDLLLLRIDCISSHPISGTTISWYDHKNRKSINNLPVPLLCKEAVECLVSITSEIRPFASNEIKQRLFIYKPKNGRNVTPIVSLSKQVFTKWCSGFCDKHSICDSGGNPYKITSHMFRRTLATDMLSKGVNIKVIQEALGHTSPATTKKYYADVKDAERADMFLRIGILGKITDVNNKIIESTSELQWFENNCNRKARLPDGYCTLPIKDGKPCGRYLSRSRCYFCSRYITTVDDLEIHKNHLNDLQTMIESNIYGEHFVAHILPTVAVLKEIIKRLEQLKNG